MTKTIFDNKNSFKMKEQKKKKTKTSSYKPNLRVLSNVLKI